MQVQLEFARFCVSQTCWESGQLPVGFSLLNGPVIEVDEELNLTVNSAVLRKKTDAHLL